jgi:hypothetical protein
MLINAGKSSIIIVRAIAWMKNENGERGEIFPDGAGTEKRLQ